MEKILDEYHDRDLKESRKELFGFFSKCAINEKILSNKLKIEILLPFC